MPIPETRETRAAPYFATTHWSVVLAAGQAQPAARADALERLCAAYWYPIYAYARRRGHGPEDAEDLTQSFFARLLERDALQMVAQEKGRFRSFLLASFNHHAADERDRAQRQKRGGGREFISLDARTPEERYALEPVDLADPVRIFERRWAMTLLDRVLERLRSELRLAGRERLIDHLQSFVVGERGDARQSEIAAALGVSENAVAVAVHRLRARYRDLLREEVAQTVCAPGEVEEELRHLLQALQG